jgi:putative transposase
VSFTCEVERAEHAPARPDTVVGVDLGITHLAVLSTGQSIANPRHLATASRKLRRLSRAMSRKVGPDRRTRREASNRWHRARLAVVRAHRRVGGLRRDGIHKLTTRLSAEHATVVVEDLNVAGMVRNRRLARAISDCGFAQIRRQLAYKTDWNGGRLVVADRWYPSSKTCSGCGAVKAKLTLSERTFTCTTCGMSLDRDYNAALNLAAYTAEATVAGSGPETLNGRGADRKTPPAGLVAAKRQPGTATAGKTGTVPSQGGTADQELTHAH